MTTPSAKAPRLPLTIVSEPGHDFGWYFADADGNEVDPQAVADALNATLSHVAPSEPECHVCDDDPRVCAFTPGKHCGAPETSVPSSTTPRVTDLMVDFACCQAYGSSWEAVYSSTHVHATKADMRRALEAAMGAAPSTGRAQEPDAMTAAQVRQQVIQAAYRPGPMCRDCGDRDGTCYDGKKCDPFEAALDVLREHASRSASGSREERKDG